MLAGQEKPDDGTLRVGECSRAESATACTWRSCCKAGATCCCWTSRPTTSTWRRCGRAKRRCSIGHRKFKPPFPHWRLYRQPRKLTTTPCLLKIPPARGFFGLCVDPSASALLKKRSCPEDQAAWNRASGRAGERGGALAGKPRGVRILTITAGSSMAAMILNSPPHCGQCSRSISNTRLSRRAHGVVVRVFLAWRYSPQWGKGGLNFLYPARLLQGRR